MLTGKAKQQFDSWYVEKSNLYNAPHIVNFYGLPLSMQFGVYQQWGDSMGYDVYTFMGDVSLHFWTIYDFNSDIDPISIECKTREEAQRAAIKKLDDLINER